MTSYKMAKMNRIKAWPKYEPFRTLVCNRCGKLMNDWESFSLRGEFYHKVREGVPCANNGKTFFLDGETQMPEKPKEVSNFEKKSARRAEKRALKKGKK